MFMNNALFTALVCLLLLTSCTTVLQKDLIKSGTFDINPTALRQETSQYVGQLYILGGIIAKTTVTEEGSLIEALYVPVNSKGYFLLTCMPHCGNLSDHTVFPFKKQAHGIPHGQ